MKEKIIVKESKRYPGLFVKKYARHVFFDASWDAATLEARGHVFNSDGKIVINAFTKVFNYTEPNETGNPTRLDRDAICTVVRKVNGFLGCATYVPEFNKVIVSTTGSLDSDFVKYAEDMLPASAIKHIEGEYKSSNRAKTWMFEIVHPEDPHIVSEIPGAYLIGCRYVDIADKYTSDGDLEFSLDYSAKLMGVMRPSWYNNVRFGDLVSELKTVKHEGWMVYSDDSCLKIKSPFYLALKAAARKKDIMSLDKTRVDEEFFPLIDHIKSNFEEFNAMEEQDRLKYMRDFLFK